MFSGHLIARNYRTAINAALPVRLTALVATWMRVGYCQGNFNSDNCAAG